MRVSEFWNAVDAEFGAAYGRFVTRDLVLTEFGDRSAAEAVEAGDDVRQVWIALCAATDVPKSRWYGVGQLRS
jgi:hypothetical protein